MITTNGAGRTSLVALDVQLATDEFLHRLGTDRLPIPPGCEAEADAACVALAGTVESLRRLQVVLGPHVARLYGDEPTPPGGAVQRIAKPRRAA